MLCVKGCLPVVKSTDVCIYLVNFAICKMEGLDDLWGPYQLYVHFEHILELDLVTIDTPWFLEECQIIECVWLLGSKLHPDHEAFLSLWTFLMYLAFSESVPHLSLCSFCPCFLFFNRGEWVRRDVASHTPHYPQASHDPKPTSTSVYCIRNVQTSHQHANFILLFSSKIKLSI